MTGIDHLTGAGRITDPTPPPMAPRGGPERSAVREAGPFDRPARLDHDAAAPAGMKALGAVYGYVATSGLPKRLIDLVFLRVSQINGCAFCIDMHAQDLLKAGLPVAQLLLLPVWHEAEALFDAQEQAALAWAEAVTRLGQGSVSDRDYMAAAEAFEPKALADLTIAIGLMNAYNRMAISFRKAPPSTR